MKMIFKDENEITISDGEVKEITFVNGYLIVILENGAEMRYSKESLNGAILNFL